MLPQVGAAGQRQVELLAPAGGPDAALAAFHFGADAIYLGLKKFSARAEAENFTIDEVDAITAYAHSLQPRRRVFVTINTLIRQDELAELVEVLVQLERIGVDAIILQDLGVYRLMREHFPQMERHGSTQMAVHNRAGAEILKTLGFSRVVLARELTFEEVHAITQTAGIETEVFIHGALCYSYSGLCLFSSQELGRSGNRGKCAYSCRDSYEVEGAPLTLRDGSAVKRDPRNGFPFSMKDLALPDHMPALRAAGVSCFKIEGRKKSPLYVATTTDYYRRLLSGTLAAHDRPGIEADLQTVFSRPWTRLFLQSHKDKEVADRDTVGHRGTPIGKVEAVIALKGQTARLRFRTGRAIERHDGIQIDLPQLGKPFGFPVDRLYLVEDRRRPHGRETIQAPADALVEVELPRDYPHLAVGAPVYCSSSQAVKQRYQYTRPKEGQFRTRRPLHVEATLGPEQLLVTVWTKGANGDVLRETLLQAGSFAAADDVARMHQTARHAFERLGDSRFELTSFAWHNESGRFVPVSLLNRLRRELVQRLDARCQSSQDDRIDSLRQLVLPKASEGTRATRQSGGDKPRRSPTTELRWSIKVDRIDFLDALEPEDWTDIDEVLIDIGRDHPHVLEEKLGVWKDRIGEGRIRLSLPPLTRAWEEKGLLRKIESLRQAGWNKWEAGNLSAWSYLGLSATPAGSLGVDLSTDWSVYIINRLAAQQVLDMGATRFALSPEDGLENWRSLLAEFGDQAVLIVHQDTPLFLAESCAYANLIGGCPGKANCSFESMQMVSSHGEKVTALDYHCRTIVLSQGPFCLSQHLQQLADIGARHVRVDFIYRKYEAADVKRRWRDVRRGAPVAGGHAANLKRGLL